MDSIGLANLVTPVASLHGDDGELGQNDGPTDGSGYLPGALDTQMMSTVILSGDKCLEPGPAGQHGSAFAQALSSKPCP